MRFAELKLYGDIAAERTIVAEKGMEKIVVEIKSFLGRSAISEFEKHSDNIEFTKGFWRSLNLLLKFT